VWREDHTTRIVWITLLAMADRHGIAEGSVPGLADFARVTVAECRSALAALMAPDPDSRSVEHEGRRIKAIDGGWQILNHAKYRQRLGADERREYLRQKQADYRRGKKSTNVSDVSDTYTLLTHTEAEAEASTEATRSKPSRASRSSEYPADFLTAYAAYPRKVGKAEAAKVWTRQKPDLSTVVAALAWQSKQPDWTKDGGQFVPHMATWLNQRRWEDEPPRGTTGSPRPELGSWRDECQRVHGGHNGDFCGNQTMHHARMQRQVTA
jgi:hypothetical protein